MCVYVDFEMPAIADWRNNPSEVIQHIFENHADANWQEKIREFFQTKISDKATLASIPSINWSSARQQQHLRPGSLVRFRGMIQDMFDPELFAGVYETRDPRTQGSVRRCGLYSDLVDADSVTEIDVDSPSTVTHERMTYYCVPVPGENNWVREAYEAQCTYNPAEFTSTDSVGQQPSKRPLDQDDDSTGTPMDTESGQGDALSSRKALRTQPPDSGETTSAGEAMGPTTDATITSTTPTPTAPPPLGVEACLVKVYDNTASISLNDCFEFIGILSIEPSLAFSAEAPEGTQSAFLSAAEEIDQEERRARCPPSSLVPRIHAIVSRRLQHNNPLLPTCIISDEDKLEMDAVLAEAGAVRRQLHGILEQALLGDKIAADYFLCHLISSVYIRKDVVALGKFSLNLTNIPTEENYPGCLHQLLQAITTQVFFFPMTLSNMNAQTFIPKKDYKANRLNTGLLQLSQHTHLVLDETALTPGRLDANGVCNLTSLGILISWQKVTYDFSFHKMEFLANVPVLVLSEGKSLLPSDFRVPLSPAQNFSAEDGFEAIIGSLTPTLLVQIRRYLTAVKIADYKLSEELQAVVQDDFVQSRQRALESNRMTTEDFHRLLLLARLLTLSEGHTSLTHEAWNKAKLMEEERKKRLPRAQ